MGLFKQIVAEIQTLIEAKNYKKNKNTVRATMLAMDKAYPVPTLENYAPHPQYAEHLKKCQSNFVDYAIHDMKKDNDKTIGIGDSLLAQAVNEVSEVIDPRLNWALGGARACHIVTLLKDMIPIMKQYGFTPKNIVVGTPDGNGLLVHNEINNVIEQCNILLNFIRQEFFSTRIIIYGIPMAIIDYIIQNYSAYQTNLFNWMMKDVNAVLLPLIKDFVEGYHIMMKSDYSCDGVHLSPKGRYLFGQLIQKGKCGSPNRLINKK
jgi:hypothetical protein